MKKLITAILSASIISASAGVPVMAAGPTTTKTTITPTMTYVDYDDADTAMGYISAENTAITGYNSISNGTISFHTPKWKVDKIAYLKVDASKITDINIVKATLTINADANGRNHAYGITNVAYTGWDETLTYNIAEKNSMRTGTALGSTVSVSQNKTSDIKFDITDALKDDADRIVTIAVYDTAAGGGNIKNPSVEVEHINLNQYTVTYDVEGTQTTESVFEGYSGESIPTPAKAGYSFDGWAKDGDTTTLYTNEQVAAMAITADTTFTAQFTIDANHIDLNITGSDSVKAGGESATYTFTATQGGEDATASLAGKTINWSIRSDEDTNNGNRSITINNGVLTVADGVLPQTIYVYAASEDNMAFGSKAVTIEASDNQKETLLYSNACETAIDTAERVESVDGSLAYLTTASTDITFGGDYSSYTLTDLDIKFTGTTSDNAGGGILFKPRTANNSDSSFYARGSKLQAQTGSDKYQDLYTSLKRDTWYHLQILYSTANASVNIYEYSADGTMTLVQTATDIPKRNAKSYGRIQVSANTYIDNIKVVSPIADSLSLSAPADSMYSGDTAQFTTNASRAGLPLVNYSALSWSVLDDEGLPIIDGSATIDPSTGLVRVAPMADLKKLTVKATVENGPSDTASINVLKGDIFDLTNIGVNEDGTKIVKLYAEKKYSYSDDVVFILTIFDGNGKLAATKHLATFGDRLALGSNELTLDFDLPEGFDSNTYTISGMVWTTLN